MSSKFQTEGGIPGILVTKSRCFFLILIYCRNTLKHIRILKKTFQFIVLDIFICCTLINIRLHSSYWQKVQQNERVPNSSGLVNLMFIDISMYRCNDDLSMVHYKNCWTDTSLLISCNIRPISTVQKTPMGCATRMSSCYLKYYFHL